MAGNADSVKPDNWYDRIPLAPATPAPDNPASVKWRDPACDMCDAPLPDGVEWCSVGGFLGVCRPCWIAGRIREWAWLRQGAG